MSMRCSYSLAIFGMRRDLRRKMPRRRMLLHWGSWQLRASSRTSACTRASGRVGHKHQSCCSRYSANYNNNYNNTTDFNEVEHNEFRRVPDMSLHASYSLAIFGMRRDLRRKMPRRRMLLHWVRASSRTSACTRACFHYVNESHRRPGRLYNNHFFWIVCLMRLSGCDQPNLSFSYEGKLNLSLWNEASNCFDLSHVKHLEK